MLSKSCILKHDARLLYWLTPHLSPSLVVRTSTYYRELVRQDKDVKIIFNSEQL